MQWCRGGHLPTVRGGKAPCKEILIQITFHKAFDTHSWCASLRIHSTSLCQQCARLQSIRPTLSVRLLWSHDLLCCFLCGQRIKASVSCLNNSYSTSPCLLFGQRVSRQKQCLEHNRAAGCLSGKRKWMQQCAWQKCLDIFYHTYISKTLYFFSLASQTSSCAPC